MWPYIEETDDFKDGISSGTAMYYKAKADASGDGKSAIFISPLAK